MCVQEFLFSFGTVLQNVDVLNTDTPYDNLW